MVIKELVGAILLKNDRRFDAITWEEPIPDLRETLEFLMQCTGLKPHSRVLPRGPSRWVEVSSALSLIDIRCRIREEGHLRPAPRDEPEGTGHE